MKRLLLICICLVYFMSTAWSKGINIRLYDDYETKEIDKRMMSITPIATYDRSTIEIYFPVAVASLWITIKDTTGNIIYSDMKSVSSKSYRFELCDLLIGEEYTLEIELEGQYFYGYFIP